MRCMTRVESSTRLVVAPDELLEREHARHSVEHRLERSQTKLFGKRLCVEPIVLVAGLVAPTGVAHDHLLRVRNDEVVHPLSLRSFLEDNMDSRAGALHELQNRPCLRWDRGSQHDRASLIARYSHHSCLVHVEREILNGLLLRGGRSFLRSSGFWQFQRYREERIFNMR